MEAKRIQWIITGMQRDVTPSKFSPKHAYENYNLRLTAKEDNTLLSITNEKGTKQHTITGLDNSLIQGTYLGHAVLNRYLIIFTVNESSNIYKLEYDPNNNTFTGTLFFTDAYKEEKLNFNRFNPIETVTMYENEDIQKVYWTDGLNPPKFLNIVEPNSLRLDAKYFSFAPKISLNEEIEIVKNTTSNGLFNPGTIQYAFTYFNRFGQETNIFYTSPLNYISYLDRGADVDSTVSNSFNIKFTNISTDFDYLRMYSIQRTSVDTTPTVRKIQDIKINKRYGATISADATIPINTSIWTGTNPDSLFIIDNFGIQKQLTDYSYTTTQFAREYHHTYQVSLKAGNIFYHSSLGEIGYKTNIDQVITFTHIIQYSRTRNLYFKSTTGEVIKGSYQITELPYFSGTYTDNGTQGELIDPTILLYIGGETFTAQTITQKDNTLFLGNIELKRRNISEEIRQGLKETLSQSTNIGYRNSIKEINPSGVTGTYPYKNQLQYSSDKIKTFKYLETYRFGVQFQHITGKWSEAIYLKDMRNNIPIKSYVEGSATQGEIETIPNTQLVEGFVKIDNIDVLTKLKSLGYIKARPIVVFPDVVEREVVAQGILCPTVYNVEDRFDNSPFVQSSWFARPNSPFDILLHSQNQNSDPTTYNSYIDGTTISADSSRGIMEQYTVKDGQNNIDLVNKGSLLEFRHNLGLINAEYRGGEIQNSVGIFSDPGGYYPPDCYVDNNDEITKINYAKTFPEYFFIDQSILTFHSPDIEFDESVRALNNKNLKLRIVGQVPITSTTSDIDIMTKTPVKNNKATGFYKESMGTQNVSRHGWKGMVNGFFWHDSLCLEGGDSTSDIYGFMVYPWQRNGSLNNDVIPSDGDTRSAMLDKKKMSNLRYSLNSLYYTPSNIWKAYEEGSSTKTGISGVAVFDSDTNSIIKIPKPVNSDLDDINYKANIDKIINTTRISGTSVSYWGMTFQDAPMRENGYRIIINGAAQEDPHARFITNGSPISTALAFKNGTEPIRMKYKSTPHAVLALNYTQSKAQRILPTIKFGEWTGGINVSSSTKYPFWKGSINTVSQDVIDTFASPNIHMKGSLGFGYLWLAELYNDDVQNKFGGNSEEAIQNNTWIPAGEPVSLIDPNTGNVKYSIELVYSEGDTYYQRYDHLKTYPYTMEDQNSVVDIVSFMCETRVNIDGRYDRNRGQIDNTVMSPLNFNKLNPAYSQQNNFFNYRAMDYNRLDLNKFPNAVTWSKQKYAGELIDTWTNLNLSSIMDMDGDKGQITALRRLNNEVFCFQDQGISRILFNSRVQIPTSDGVPVEISNSYKVDGKVYLSETIGCTNKWSIVTTPFGLYFTDDITNSIQLFNGQELVNISDAYGFRTFLHDNSTSKKWNAETFENFITFYDKNNKDVYFVNENYCLGYSELLKQFTSFYSYEATPMMVNMGKHMFMLKNNKLWEMNGGHYNHIYGKLRPYYTTLIANPDEPEDKIFSTVNFRSDTYNSTGLLSNITFDTFSIWNEYQQNTINLTQTKGKPSNLKKKFRSWNITIPRDKANKRDRIRNPWVYLKLGMENPGVYKTELHDIILNYFI